VKEAKAIAGFEKSGHFFFNKPIGLGYDDGLLSAIQVCKLLETTNLKISEIIDKLPVTFQTPTMAPFCSDEEKYKLVETVSKKIVEMKGANHQINNKFIKDLILLNGVRFILDDDSWGLIRASSNKPSLVIVVESLKSGADTKKIFNFINNLLQKTGKIGEYDQKI